MGRAISWSLHKWALTIVIHKGVGGVYIYMYTYKYICWGPLFFGNSPSQKVETIEMRNRNRGSG